MWVDPFWLGFCVGVVVGIVGICIVAMIYVRRGK